MLSDRSGIQGVIRSSRSLAEVLGSLFQALEENGEDVEGSRDPNSISTEFGKRTRPYRELLAHRFCLAAHPGVVPVGSRSWRSDPGYIMAMFLWMLRGSADVEEIAFYNPSARAFASESGTYESALGPRIAPGCSRKGLIRIVEVLRTNSRSRRAFLPVIWPEDVARMPRDYPCLASLHFLVRHDRLQAICNMRSQSVHLLVTDTIIALMAQGLVAARTGLPPGDLHYISNSVHMYHEHRVRFSGADHDTYEPLPSECTSGEWLSSDAVVGECQDLERALRTGSPRSAAAAIAGASPAVREPMRLIGIAALRCLGATSEAAELVAGASSSLGRRLWPDLSSAGTRSGGVR
jgi:hypothetical protein